MFYLILLYACIASAATWVALLLMPARWFMSERWESSGSLSIPASQWPSLSVVVPARNESASFPLTLPSWLSQDYPNSEIIVVDDESCDNTAECAKDIAKQHNRTIHILNGTPPPTGWTGKLWALEQGIRASSGDWLLFTDADICHSPNLWKGLVAKALTEHRSMVSLMALLDTRGMWARLLIPAFVYFFHLLYPFRKVNNQRSSLSAAAGGCILVSRHTLDKTGGIAGYCNAWIDDIALAKQIKNAGFPISLSLTKSITSIRPYQGFRDIWDMVARSAFAQLRYSWFMLAGTVLGLAILFIAPIAGICIFAYNPTTFSIILPSGIALLSMAVTYLPILRFYNLRAWRSFTLPVSGVLYLAMTVSSAINHLSGKRMWRGTRAKTHNKT